MWIGVTIGIFFVGLAIGYTLFSGSVYPNNMMNNQQMMLQDLQFRQQMMESITQDPETMRIWMNDTQHAEDMGTMMRANHDFAMQMMYAIIEDPTTRLQMLGHMTENPEAMQQMMDMMESDMMNNMTGGMMDSGMRGMVNKEMMTQIMNDPEAKEKMLQLMSKHVGEMQDLISSELANDEFSTKMMEIMQSHMKEMQNIMPRHSMHQTMN